jgi:hypothetical protein
MDGYQWRSSLDLCVLMLANLHRLTASVFVSAPLQLGAAAKDLDAYSKRLGAYWPHGGYGASRAKAAPVKLLLYADCCFRGILFVGKSHSLLSAHRCRCCCFCSCAWFVLRSTEIKFKQLDKR